LQKLSPQNETVRVFYKEWWDNADNSLIPESSTPISPSAACWGRRLPVI
jgi:hypothetical protein